MIFLSPQNQRNPEFSWCRPRDISLALAWVWSSVLRTKSLPEWGQWNLLLDSEFTQVFLKTLRIPKKLMKSKLKKVKWKISAIYSSELPAAGEGGISLVNSTCPPPPLSACWSASPFHRASGFNASVAPTGSFQSPNFSFFLWKNVAVVWILSVPKGPCVEGFVPSLGTIMQPLTEVV